MIGHAIFDLDGTLVDSAAVCTMIINEMLVDRGSPRRLADGAARTYLSVGGAPMMAALLAGDCGDPDREIAEFRARYAGRSTPFESLFCGVESGLVRLRDAGVVLSICSNKPQNLCEKVLDDLGLISLFSAIVGSSAAMPKKPHPAMLEAVMERAGGMADESIFIGDSELDRDIAAAVGLPFIFVGHGYAEGGDFSHALHCDDFASVPDRVLELLALQRDWQPRRMTGSA